MSISEYFIQNAIPIFTIYFFIIIFSTLILYFKAKSAYNLSHHPGLKYFKNAFLYFTIGFLSNYAIIFWKNFLPNSPLIYGQILTFIFVYTMSMSGFSLVYSLVWRKFDVKNQNLMPLLHLQALITALIIFVSINVSLIFMFIIQISIFIFATAVSHHNYKTSIKKTGFIKIYPIIMFLALIAWIINLISHFYGTSYPAINLLSIIITTLIFLTLVYGVLNDNARKRLLFFVLFSIIVFISTKIDIYKIQGTDRSFTLIEFFGPLAGGFLGPLLGIIAILLVVFINSFILGGSSLSLLNILLLFPIASATYYFSTKKKFIALIPILAIILFILHPYGGPAWFYSLIWIIPIIVVFLPRAKYRYGKLFLRSLGATLTAHSVGTIIWLYIGNITLTASDWIGLIPTTMYERIFFAIGITISFLILNGLLNLLVQKIKIPTDILKINKRYLLLQKNGKKARKARSHK